MTTLLYSSFETKDFSSSSVTAPEITQVTGVNDCIAVVDDDFCWLQTNRNVGNMVPGLSTDWLRNRERGMHIFSQLSSVALGRVVRMKPLNQSSFVDLDLLDTVPDVIETDGFITSDTDLIMNANPADCGEVAVVGHSSRLDKRVAALLHASRKIVDEGGHIQALDYFTETYGVSTREMKVVMSPSARKESYKFEDISEEQKVDFIWHSFIHEDDEGYWHVDFHGKTIDDLLAFGIQPDNIIDTGVDTISDPDYYSSFE